MTKIEKDAADAKLGHCTKRIVGALQKEYDTAAFAVESQLETLLGDEKAMPILASSRG